MNAEIRRLKIISGGQTGADRAALNVGLAEGNPIAVLNVAGPRESKRPGVYESAYRLLNALLPHPGA